MTLDAHCTHEPRKHDLPQRYSVLPCRLTIMSTDLPTEVLKQIVENHLAGGRPKWLKCYSLVSWKCREYSGRLLVQVFIFTDFDPGRPRSVVVQWHMLVAPFSNDVCKAIYMYLEFFLPRFPSDSHKTMTRLSLANMIRLPHHSFLIVLQPCFLICHRKYYNKSSSCTSSVTISRSNRAALCAGNGGSPPYQL